MASPGVPKDTEETQDRLHQNFPEAEYHKRTNVLQKEFCLLFNSCYRPQRSCGKVMFLHQSVSHSVHRGGLCPSMHHRSHGQGVSVQGVSVWGVSARGVRVFV